MKNILIVKTGAAGDVLRTTFVLEDLSKKYNRERSNYNTVISM